MGNEHKHSTTKLQQRKDGISATLTQEVYDDLRLQDLRWWLHQWAVHDDLSVVTVIVLACVDLSAVGLASPD